MSGIYTNEQLRRLHAIELEILDETARVCQELGLVFFSAWGTTLGAIRHDGFIPWDDDVDIGMLREDFEIFLREAPKLLHPNFSLQHFSIDQRIPYIHAKIMKKGTLFVEKSRRKIDIEQGIFIDIMPFDFISSNPKKRKWQKIKQNVLCQLFLAKSNKTATFTQSKIKRIVFTIVRFTLHVFLLPFSKRFLFNLFDKACKKSTDSKEFIISYGHPNSDAKLSDYFPLQEHRFESQIILVPNAFETVLEHFYGDWRRLPPEKARVGHSPVLLEFGED